MNDTTQHLTPAAAPPAAADAGATAHAVHVPAAAANAVAFLGGRVDVRLSGEHTSGWLSVHDSRLPVGTASPLHTHPNDEESFVVLDGSVEYFLDGTCVLAHTGDALHIPRGVPHAFRVVSPAGARMLGISTPAGHERFFGLAGDPLDAPPHAPGPPDMARMQAAADAAGFELLGPPPFGD
jgi:quercetin dioxygenase-like cupin family protein